MTSQQTTASPSEFAGKFQDLIAEAREGGLEVGYEGAEGNCSCCMPTEVDVYVYPENDWGSRVFVTTMVY